MTRAVASAVPGIHWPVLPDPAAAQILALVYQFEQSEWWPAAQVESLQDHQLRALLDHAVSRVPFYRDRLAGVAGAHAPLGREAWLAIPVLTRQDVQRAGMALESETPIHGERSEIRTSGSTGTPVRIQATQVTRTFVLARYLRNHLWHGRDFAGKAATIRNFAEGVAMPPQGETTHGWGIVYRSGPLARLNIRATVDEQLAWLERERPQYLWSLASNVRALVARAAELGIALPSLRQVSTFGESLDPRLRARCRETWGAEIVDIYSSEEFGPIALQCPEHLHYHLQSEGLRVEILDEHGRPCRPGAVGRVVITDLHNFATPLIRYELGDHAEAGPPCPCGRGLPVLARVLGRTRHMMRLRDGLRWPTLPSGDDMQRLAPVRQFQVVQRTLDHFEARLVVERPLSAEEERRVRDALLRDLGVPARLSVAYVERIERSPAGKYEDFRSEVGG